MKKSDFENMTKEEVFAYCKKEKDKQLAEKESEIEVLKAKHDEFSEYSRRYQVLNERFSKIEDNIFHMSTCHRYDNWGTEEAELERISRQAEEIRKTGEAEARVYNIMLREFDDENSEIMKDVLPEVKNTEYIKLKYEKLFMLLKYRMLEFDIRNDPCCPGAYRNKEGRFFVLHNYFGDTHQDEEEADVDSLDELRNEKYEFKREKPHDYHEPQTPYDQWLEEQALKELDEEYRKLAEKQGVKL